MILSCKFDRHKCDDEDFVLFQYPELFNCYTLKRGRDSNLTTVHGLGGELSMVLYIEPQENDINYIYDDLVVANNQGLCTQSHLDSLKTRQTRIVVISVFHIKGLSFQVSEC